MTRNLRNIAALLVPLLLLQILISCGQPPPTPYEPEDSEKPTITISRPAAGAVLDVDEDVVVEGTVSDNIAVVSSLIDLGGGEPERMDLAADGSFSHNLGALPFGLHTLRITASDAAGNTATEQVQFKSKTIPSVPCTDHAIIIDVPDPGLAAALRNELGLAPGEDITCEAVRVLTSLAGYNKGIEDLEGLQHAVELQSLYMPLNEIQNLRPLAGLTALTTVSLSQNEITDLSPLAGLTALTSVSLWENKIADLLPLAGLSSLQELYLSNNRISDVAPLAQLPALVALDLWDNNIGHVAPLYNLGTLVELYLSNNPLPSLAGINALESLELLWITDLNLRNADLEHLDGLVHLKSLRLDRNDLTDLVHLPVLPGIEQLSIASNNLDAIGALKNLQQLKSLDLSNNRISSLQPLVENPGLDDGDWLDVSENCLDVSNPGATNYPELFELEGRGLTVSSGNQKPCT